MLSQIDFQDSLATICLLDYSQFESHHLLSEEHLHDLAKQTAAAILGMLTCTISPFILKKCVVSRWFCIIWQPLLRILKQPYIVNNVLAIPEILTEFGGRSPQSQLSRYFDLWAKMQSELSSAKIPHCAFTDVTQLVRHIFALSLSLSSIWCFIS